MNTTSPCPPDGNPGDEAFEVFLATADDQLLAHVRSHTDPVRVLNALLDVLDEPTATPAYPYTTPRRQVTEKVIQRLTSRLTVQTLVIDLAHARDLANSLDDTLAHVRLAAPLALDLAERLVAVRDLVQDLDADLVPDVDVDRRLDRLFRNLDRACASLRRFNLNSSRLDALTLLSNLDLGRDLKIAMEIKDGLLRSLVDVSGVDLTRLDAPKAMASAQVVEALDGVVWDDSTRWPPGLKKIMEVWSEPIEGSRYRVRAGNERDSHVR